MFQGTEFPKEIVSDNDPQFKSHDITCSQYSIISDVHAQADKTLEEIDE